MKNNKKYQCILFIDCKNEENAKKMKEYFEKYVNTSFLDFLNRFDDHQVDRGFLNTIQIPDFMENK